MAREAERNALLTRLACRSGQSIVDAPAGGGYVGDGLNARMGGRVTIVCVEPSPKFAAAIGNRFETLVSPIDRITLPDSSVDGVVSLAGVHHIGDKTPLYREWARLLRSGRPTGHR
jgi:ubiquinone/menaquinone biosynthesis C-methylase UbiE